jgi:hypothetical protein
MNLEGEVLGLVPNKVCIGGAEASDEDDHSGDDLANVLPGMRVAINEGTTPRPNRIRQLSLTCCMPAPMATATVWLNGMQKQFVPTHRPRTAVGASSVM